MVAVVAGIRRYPIKGLGGETLDSADLDHGGMAWDRAVGLPNGRLSLQESGRWTSFEAFHSLKTDSDTGNLSAHVEPVGAGIVDARAITVTSPDGPVMSIRLDADNCSSNMILRIQPMALAPAARCSPRGAVVGCGRSPHFAH